MPLKIINGRLQGARFVRANSFGGKMRDVTAVVLHDTAGRLDKFSSVNWFASKQCTTSAHFTVERDGTITQQVPADCKAYHAGKSQWGGRSLCNGFTVGIEIVNPGKLDANGKAWFGKATSDKVVKATTKEHGSGYWLPYTPEQITAVKALCRALCEEYPNCNEILTHWLISPGRKIDTNPLFPLEEVRAYALGTGESGEEDTPPAVAAVDAPVATGLSQDQGVLTTARDLAASSRKVSFLSRGVALLKAAAASFVGLFTLDNFQIAKGAITDVKGMAHDLALPGLFVLIVCGVLAGRYLLGRIRTDYEEGRYTPSGHGA